MNYPKYVEVQRFRQIWIWLAMIWVAAICLYFGLRGFYIQIVLGQPWGEMPMSDAGMIFFTLLMLAIGLGIPAIFFTASLKTEIDRDSIRFSFRPFLFKTRSFRWSEIRQAHVRRYKPLLEYGGWGIRFGLSGRAYNVSGNMGLQIEFRSGKKLLIGTRKPEELRKFLEKEILPTLSGDL
jgi:hypothetical protein